MVLIYLYRLQPTQPQNSYRSTATKEDPAVTKNEGD